MNKTRTIEAVIGWTLITSGLGKGIADELDYPISQTVDLLSLYVPVLATAGFAGKIATRHGKEIAEKKRIKYGTGALAATLGAITGVGAWSASYLWGRGIGMGIKYLN